MFSQTIALFRYLLLGLINIKVLIFLLVITVCGILVGEFVKGLAIINSDLISLAFVAEFIRYCLVLFMVVTITHKISQDFELGQLDRLLSMPITRAQYVFAQLLVILTVGFYFSITVLGSVLVFAPLEVTTYWFLSIYFELVLMGLFTMLAILSLEKLPVAIIFTLSFYLLSRLLPLINEVLQQSREYYSEEPGHQFAEQFVTLLQYVFPGSNAFAQNNILLGGEVEWWVLLQQSLSVFIYGGFLMLICLIDFYRKEFNH